MTVVSGHHPEVLLTRSVTGAAAISDAAVVDCRGLTRRYGRHTALDQLTVRLPRGQILGVLGPNGAGKTTFVLLVSTLLRPTDGSVRVCGFDPERRAVDIRRRIGLALTSERSVYWRLSGRENLQHFGRAYGLRGPALRRRIDAMVAQFELESHIDRLVGEYSAGLRARLCIARAFLHEPDLIVLDEPWATLDPEGRQALKESVRRARETAGVSVVLTSHDLGLVEDICDVALLLRQGKTVAAGTPAELIRQSGIRGALRIEFASVEGAQRAADALGADYDLTIVTVPTADPSTALPSILQRVDVATVTRVEVLRPTLEAAYLSLSRQVDPP